jgi:hypothetical protein
VTKPARFAALLFLICGLVAGCGSSKDKGINKDLDRPIPAKKAAPGGDEKTQQQ